VTMRAGHRERIECAWKHDSGVRQGGHEIPRGRRWGHQRPSFLVDGQGRDACDVRGALAGACVASPRARAPVNRWTSRTINAWTV
jgi:hypothetical protein